jgi:serine/threonine protein kinase/sugar lactone lactonase YvrE
MQPERWQQVDQVFQAALERTPEERAAFISGACGDDDSLRREVEALLAADRQAGSLIKAPAYVVAAPLIVGGDAQSLLGRTVGHCRIVSLLGKGGMGEVYRAEDTRLRREVAIKVLPDDFAKDASRLRRFEQEARAASALNHPNILTIHEIGEAEGTRYIVTEYVAGETLRQRLACAPQQKMESKEAVEIALQIATALSAAHEAGITHRDIKPENVMVRPDGLVKVLDFGLAKLTEGRRDGEAEGRENGERVSLPLSVYSSLSPSFSTEHGMVMGTVSYMSPEQASGQKVDHRTDIFSLGVMLYEMIVGRRPFEGATTSEMIAGLLTTDPPRLRQHCAAAMAELERIVGKCLAKEREARYQSAKELIAELKTLRTSSQMEESAVRRTSGARTRLASRRWPLVAALAAVALAVIGFAWHQFARWSPPILSAPFASEILSTNGKVAHAVVSPDGKKVVYTNGIDGRQSIWLRQLDSANNLELIPPSDVVYGGLALSPDGQFLYFARRPKSDAGQLTIYRMALGGGVPTPLIADTQGSMSLSLDGEKVSFVRRAGPSILCLADARDGKSERKLAERSDPARIAGNAIAPDGKSVAFAAGQSMNAANGFSLVAVDLASGVERELTPQKFFNIKNLAWLPDQSGLLLTASVIPNKNFRIWQVSTATGQATPLTNDSETYSGLSLDKNARALVSTRVKSDHQLRLVSWENPSARQDLADARTLAFAPDGRLVFSSAMAGSDEIWSIKADGSEQRQLTNEVADDNAPVVAPDNQAIFFASNRTGQAHVWRMNTDGGQPTQITQKEGGFPLFMAPDGQWIYYLHGLQRTLWRVSANGGTEQLVVNQNRDSFAGSPDGLQVAFADLHGQAHGLKIVWLADGRTRQTFPLPAPQALLRRLAWLPDGNSVAYLLSDQSYEKYALWQQPLAGGPPRRIAALGDEGIGAFAIAPDGKSFAIVQGGWRHDAVLLKGLK